MAERSLPRTSGGLCVCAGSGLGHPPSLAAVIRRRPPRATIVRILNGMTQRSWLVLPPRLQRYLERWYGVKPVRAAPKLDRLLWFRNYYLRSLPLIAPAWVVWLVTGMPFSWVFLAVISLPWVLGFARLNVEIRRERRGADSPP